MDRYFLNIYIYEFANYIHRKKTSMTHTVHRTTYVQPHMFASIPVFFSPLASWTPPAFCIAFVFNPVKPRLSTDLHSNKNHNHMTEHIHFIMWCLPLDIGGHANECLLYVVTS
jgi:hypothetical protein